MRVLIAEDLALLRDGLTRLLRDNGFEVIDAVDNADALVHAARAEKPDIAIVDVRLPPSFRDAGIRAALELRATVPETAIIVVSQYVEQEYATELLASGHGGVGSLLKDRSMHVDDVGWPRAGPRSTPRTSRSSSRGAGRSKRCHRASARCSV